MKTHREVWDRIKKDKLVRIELNVSSTPSLQEKAVRSFRRLMSKQKNIDDAYKARQPHATLTSEVVDVIHNGAGSTLLTLEFKLTEVASREEI